MKVMVIEDEEMLLRAISKKLTKSGFETVTCTNAKQALDYLGSFDENPDAIWLDSGKPRSLYGRFDIISASPDTVLETIGKTTRIIL